MVRKTKGGYRLFSKKTGKPLGPTRGTPEQVTKMDEKRVQFFQNLKNSSGGPGSLAAKVKKTNPKLVKKVKG